MWKIAVPEDIEELADLFWEHIMLHPEYISHGELQMGVASAPGKPAAGGKEIWKKYIGRKIAGAGVSAGRPVQPDQSGVRAELPDFNSRREETSRALSVVFIYRENEKIAAFCVLDTSRDGGNTFGIICDMLVAPSLKGCGIGKQLLEKAREWFGAQGICDIYLESGIHNHAAHSFFEKHGFEMVSHIFKLI